MAEGMASAALRIGELSRRVGLSEHVLRAWERRYGVLQPQRSTGGYRLYSEADEQRIRRMQAHVARGLSPAEAARAALADEWQAQPGGPPRPGGREDLAVEAGVLARSLAAFDEPGAQAALDRLLGAFTTEMVLREVVLPYLRDLGQRWARGQLTVGEEHFASNLLRGRLAGLARGWGNGRGPQALLACAPGEQHDIALLCFGIVLHRNGWLVRYLGADTPLADLARIAGEVRPDVVVVTAATPERFAPITRALADIAGTAPLALAGSGATSALAGRVGAALLAGDPVTEAEQLRPAIRRPGRGDPPGGRT